MLPAQVVRTGADVTIVAWSRMVSHALEAADVLDAEGIDAEVVDLRTIVPLDRETVLASFARTNRMVIAQEAVTNVVRHADATRVDVDVHETEDGMISVSIVDDGRRTPGAPSAEAADGGNGIAGMRERAHLLGGTFSAENQGSGFAVRASIPREVVEK